MSFLSSFLAALIPMFIYLIFIWRLDKYEREPFGKVLKHFFWGAFGAVLFGILLSTFMNSVFDIFIGNAATLAFMSTVIVAPFAEEIVKGVFLLRSFKKDYFDNLTDGLVYGGAIGLGFGMTENLLYFTTYDDTLTQWISIVITRSIFSAVMHAIATATVGAFLAKAKFSLSRFKFVYPIVGISFAMLFHAIWNFSLSFEFTYYLGILFMIFLILSFLFIFLSSTSNEKKMIENELADETILWELRDTSSGKVSLLDNVNRNFTNKHLRNKYIGFATKLAFRKFQVRNSSGVMQERYLSDISKFRDNLLELNKSRNT